MEDVPVGPIVAGAVVLLVGPVRRRVLSVARATGRAGVGVAGAAVVGAADVISAAVRGAVPSAEEPTR
jgi:hypothetical protein